MPDNKTSGSTIRQGDEIVRRRLSGPQASFPFNRKQLYLAARYEMQRSPLVYGMISQLASITISTGPSLLNPPDDEWETFIEEEIKLIDLLYQSRISKAVDGEIFWLLLDGNPLKVMLIETDQVDDPTADMITNHNGVVVDAFGEPIKYRMRKNHPESIRPSYDIIEVPASSMLMYAHIMRASQVRGVTELAPALPLIALLTRLNEASISTAESLATFTGVLETDLPPGAEQIIAQPFEALELPRNALISLPAGWRLNAPQLTQRQFEFTELRKDIIREIGRALNLPFNIAAGDSSNYNFSSARLDHLALRRIVRRERKKIEQKLLNPLLEAYTSIKNLPLQKPIEWIWPSDDLIDPVNEMEAIAKGIELGLVDPETQQLKIKENL